MKYWQNEETGMCCAVEVQPSPRYIEVSKEFYDLHESGLTPRAVDGVVLMAQDGELQAWSNNGVSVRWRPPHH